MSEPDSDQQQKLVDALKAEVRSTVQQHACLQYFCNDHTYVRYLRARNWDLKKAAKMLQATLEWRLSYKPHEIKWEQVCKEATTGKQQVYPTPDKAGRPIVVMIPRLENTKVPDSQIRFLIYHLELASRIADQTGVGKMAWLLDFEGYSLMNAPAIKTSMFCLNLLQNHYPERLGSAVCYHAPSLFTFTWKAVGPFIDPVTKAKISFVSKGPGEKEDMESRYHMDKMEKNLGGGLEGPSFVYDEYAARMQTLDRELEAAIAATAEQLSTGGVTGTGHASDGGKLTTASQPSNGSMTTDGTANTEGATQYVKAGHNLEDEMANKARIVA